MEPGNPQALNRYTYAYNNPLLYHDPSGHDAVDVINFLLGFVAQWAYNNVWMVPQAQEALAAQPNEPMPMTVGRHLGNVAAVLQGLAEVMGGAGLADGDAIACGTGVLCLAGAPAIASGVAVDVHGASVALVAANQEGQMLGNLLMAKGSGWKVGDPPSQPGPGGSRPDWETVRQRYRMNRAQNAARGEFSPQGIGRMKQGLAPQARIIARMRNTGEEVEIIVSKELHHISGRGGADPHDLSNLRELWPWEHEAIDPSRHLDWDFVRFK